MEPTNKKVSLLRIVAATVYDSLLMLGVWFLVGSLALGVKFVFTGEVSSLNPVVGMSLVILSTWLYFAMFWIYGGKTLGMSSWKLRIVSQDGNQITIIPDYHKIFIKYLYHFISWHSAFLKKNK